MEGSVWAGGRRLVPLPSTSEDGEWKDDGPPAAAAFERAPAYSSERAVAGKERGRAGQRAAHEVSRPPWWGGAALPSTLFFGSPVPTQPPRNRPAGGGSPGRVTGRRRPAHWTARKMKNKGAGGWYVTMASG